MKGREHIGQRFGEYLANFNTVYHHNGQQTVDIRGDHATGVSCCLVVPHQLPRDAKGRLDATRTISWANWLLDA
ncbi:hypothetical protein [Ramlibacter henchirensis]|uniref:hypothetical protein n=1 Tax=Ramlibacter henchirensis TaxID=204072 RepID=UPI003B84A1A5